MTDVPTFGIEEEFFVVDSDGKLAARGADILDGAEHAKGELQQELTRTQAETATGICRRYDDALEQLGSMRAGLAEAAGQRGYRLLPSGCPPLAEDNLPTITPSPRYERMAAHFGATARTSLTCGCHVHVAVPDRETGVGVIAKIRPWLPVLLTVTANSAIADGYDTGYSSWRYQQWSRWPSAGPPPRLASLAEYEGVVDAWMRAGAILDRGMVYWDVRLAEKQPTIEFRMGDVAATPAEAVLLAVLIRGLVSMALADETPPPYLSSEVLRAHLWRASRAGLTGQVPDPRTGDLAPAPRLLEDLVELTKPALAEAGDLEFARAGLARLVAEGGGADRQRKCFARRGRAEDVVDLLTEASTKP